MEAPCLTFCCELPANRLVALFDEPSVFHNLWHGARHRRKSCR